MLYAFNNVLSIILWEIWWKDGGIQESLGISQFILVLDKLLEDHPGLWGKSYFRTLKCISFFILQYVLDFRTKPKRARGFAKSNLVSAQKSIKTRYDKNNVDIPGDKDLALGPVYHKPLQARYFVSDTICT